MSGEQRRPQTPQGPPWSPDLLADLHADALDEDTARQLRPLVHQDPAAIEILAALDATRRELAELAVPAMPDDVRERICAALAAEAGAARLGADERVVGIAHARRRRRRVEWGVGLLAAAAAVLGVLIVSSPPRETHEAASPPVSAPSSPMAFSGGEVHLDRAQLTDALRSREYTAALADPRTLQGCLNANGAGDQPVGALKVTLDGRPDQLLVLPTGTIGRFRVLVVGLNCGPGTPATVSDDTFGG